MYESSDRATHRAWSDWDVAAIIDAPAATLEIIELLRA
jgi:hypothetical protein